MRWINFKKAKSHLPNARYTNEMKKAQKARRLVNGMRKEKHEVKRIVGWFGIILWCILSAAGGGDGGGGGNSMWSEPNSVWIDAQPICIYPMKMLIRRIEFICMSTTCFLHKFNHLRVNTSNLSNFLFICFFFTLLCIYVRLCSYCCCHHQQNIFHP